MLPIDSPGENYTNSEVSSLEEFVVGMTENLVNDETEDDTVALKPVTQKEALKASITLHNFLLQYENSNF